ncbi:hypothetical protein JCM6882_009053 [Rhodosporidiobolus microsporus]
MAASHACDNKPSTSAPATEPCKPSPDNEPLHRLLLLLSLLHQLHPSSPIHHRAVAQLLALFALNGEGQLTLQNGDALALLKDVLLAALLNKKNGNDELGALSATVGELGELFQPFEPYWRAVDEGERLKVVLLAVRMLEEKEKTGAWRCLRVVTCEELVPDAVDGSKARPHRFIALRDCADPTRFLPILDTCQSCGKWCFRVDGVLGGYKL